MGEKILMKGNEALAEGAIRAALFLHGKPPGRYSMADLLDLSRGIPEEKEK